MKKIRGKGNSSYLAPKQVLVFCPARKLIAIVRSMNSAAEMTGAKNKAVLMACRGCYVATAGFYFRCLHPDILVGTEDLDTLTLEEYDALCGEHRRYLPTKKLKALREEHKRTHSFHSAEQNASLEKEKS